MDWDKFERNFRKVGLRDGLVDGKNSNFQNSFDEGFCEGFRNGYVMGLYRGVLFTENKLNNTSIKDQLLSKPKRGWCQICLDDNLLSETTSKIVVAQTDVCNKNLKVLHDVYFKGRNMNLNLPNKLV